MAFDITFNSPRVSTRIHSLQKKSRPQKKDLTMDELREKLATAEARRKVGFTTNSVYTFTLF